MNLTVAEEQRREGRAHTEPGGLLVYVEGLDPGQDNGARAGNNSGDRLGPVNCPQRVQPATDVARQQENRHAQLRIA